MIFECQSNHISFSKDNLLLCAVKGCSKPVSLVSSIDIDWFYKINKEGLCIDRKDLNKILDDPNMPKEVKQKISKIFYNY